MISSAVVKVGRSNSPTATRLTSAPISSYCANSSAPVHRPMATSSRAVRDDRIEIQRCPHLIGRPVPGLRVGPGVAEEANSAQVEERGTAVGPDPLHDLAHGGDERRRIVALDPLVAQPGAMAVRRLDPTRRRPHADADPVVLADEQQRHRQLPVRGVRGGVDRSGRGGVVGRGVAEAAHDDRAGRPCELDAQLGSPAERERDPERPRQVGGDRRRLRDDRQVAVTDDLVPPAGDRLVDTAQHAEQHIRHRVPSDLRGASGIEGAGAIVQERRISRSRCERDRRRCSRDRRSRSCSSRGCARSASTERPGRAGGS